MSPRTAPRGHRFAGGFFEGIGEVLEEHATEFIKNDVQKGGQ